MHTKSTLRATARPFYPRSHSSTPTDTTHSGPPTPYITAVEPYQPHPVTYVQVGPYEHVPVYIYHQVRGIYIGARFHPQQEQYFYSHVPPPQPPVSPVQQEWGTNEWAGAAGEGTWRGDEYSGFKIGYVVGYGYGGQGQEFKNAKSYGGKKGCKNKKNWGYKGKKKGERYAYDQLTLVGRDDAIFG